MGETNQREGNQQEGNWQDWLAIWAARPPRDDDSEWSEYRCVRIRSQTGWWSGLCQRFWRGRPPLCED